MGGKLWLFLLLGCCLLAGCQQTETVSVPPAVGCYPVEGYAPDPADLAAAPYTYTGGAQGISVTCTVRQAEGQVLTLSSGEQVYLSLPLAPGQERLTLYNTPAGEYSEGVLLPHLPSYQVSLETGEGEPPLSFLLEEPAAGG